MTKENKMQYRQFLYEATVNGWRQLGMPAEFREKYGYKPQVVWYNYTLGNNKILFYFDAYKDPCKVGNKYIEATYVAREHCISIDTYNLDKHKTYNL